MKNNIYLQYMYFQKLTIVGWCVFKHCRSKRIFGRLVELASAEPQSKLMTMPWWLDYDTLIILFQ